MGIFVCVLWAGSPSVSAQASPEQVRARTQLVVVRDAIERARFAEAEAQAQALLAQSTLSARERNDTLELLAIAQIAARRAPLAHATLAELFARDPEHPQRVRDPGPSVEAYFARVRAEQRVGVAAQLRVSAAHDSERRVQIVVALGRGHDAVETVHVFSWPEPGHTAPSLAVDEPSHVVADVRARRQLVLTLPALVRSDRALLLYVEARAPSGHTLATDGSRGSPLRVRLGEDAPRREPLHPAASRGCWWWWTGAAIVIAGLGVTGALVAQ